MLVDRECRLPFTDRSMQYEAAVGLHRPTKKYRQISKTVSFKRHVNFLEERCQAHVNRSIDDHAERALVIVFGDINKGSRKIRISHCGHGDEEVISQIDALHTVILIADGNRYKV